MWAQLPVFPATNIRCVQEGTVNGRCYGERVRFDPRYPRQVWGEETGLSYNLHRYSDARTGGGRADPIGSSSPVLIFRSERGCVHWGMDRI